MGYDFKKMSALIDESGISKKKFFAKLGITEKAFNEWSAGTAIPREEAIKRIAKQLNVPLRELRESIPSDDSPEEETPPQIPSTPIISETVFRSNFHFLEAYYPKLYSDGDTAERLYLNTFYTQCITQLGMLGEHLVENILSDLELDDFFGVNHHERLRILLDEEHIPLKWFEVLDRLRLARNDALHNHIYYSKADALQFLQQTYDLTRWFAHASEIDVPKDNFVEPFHETAPLPKPNPKKSPEPPDPGLPPDDKKKVFIPKCDFLFTAKDDGLCITSYMGNDTIIDVPDKIQGKKVTEIGEQAFQNCTTIEKILLPSTVRVIGDCAFAWCENLIELQGATYIKSLGKRAFYRCPKLKTVAPMVSLSHIGKETFAGCSSLSSFFFSEKLEGIASFAFSGCRSLSEFVASNGLTLIGDHAFSDCSSLTRVIIPSTVTTIGEEAFFNCNKITTLQKPLSATLGKDAFGAYLLPKREAPPSTPKPADSQPIKKDASPKADPGQEIEKLLRRLGMLNGNTTVKNTTPPSLKMSLSEYLEYRGLEVIDKRPYRGRLWVVGTEESIGEIINDAKRIFKIGGTYCSGGRSTSYRPGWFTAAMSTEKHDIPQTHVTIDYNEVATAGKMYDKYFGKINGPLILVDESWTNEYCFVVDRLSDDRKKLEGVCYCNGHFQRYYSYPKTRQFKVFNGSTAATIAKIHNQYKRT